MKMTRLRAWAMILLFAFGVVAVAPPLLILFLFIRRKEIIYSPVRFFFRLGLRTVGVRVEVQGLEHLDPRQSYLFLSNHQSMLDIIVLLAHLRRTPAFLIKKELFRLPVFNPGLYWIDCVPVDRTHRDRAVESVHRAAAALRRGIDFVAYPEGTRTRTGRLQPFKKGPFYMAVEAGVPIVPVTVDGAFDLMPKGTIRCRPGRVRLTFHPPVPVHGYTVETLDDLMARVRRTIALALPESEADTPA
jgi:1-acyl-sn-glycerol-3-phosphate acyltransferase